MKVVENYDLPTNPSSLRFANPHRVRMLGSRLALANDIQKMPLLHADLQLVSFMRDLCAVFCIYHEEAHLAKGHVTYVDAYISGLTGNRITPGRFVGDNSKFGVTTVPDQDAERLRDLFPFNDEVSQIMELQADIHGFKKTLNFFIKASKRTGSDNSALIFLITIFCVLAQIKYVEEFHSSHSLTTHPDASVRFFCTILHYCNIFVDNDKLLSPTIVPGNPDAEKLSGQRKCIGGIAETIILLCLSWLSSFEKSFGVAVFGDQAEEVGSDLSYLLSRTDVEPADFLHNAQSVAGRRYAALCKSFHDQYAKNLLGAELQVTISSALGSMVSDNLEKESLLSGVRKPEYWPI